MNSVATLTTIIGGMLVIFAALWRIGTSLIRLIRRVDKLLREHEFLLKTVRDDSEAILKLNRRLDRMAAGNG